MDEAREEGGTLDVAIHRLDRAVAQLELRLDSMVTQAGNGNAAIFEEDRAKLAAELDAARSRERELEIAGALASQALGRAIADIKTALGEEA